MDGAALHELADAVALQLPVAELTHPFGPEWDVYKVAGKVFMLRSRLPGHGAKDVDAPGGTRIIVLKADPGDVHALQRAHPFIFPGYHLNKKHWITVVAPGEVTGAGSRAESRADDAGAPGAPDFPGLVRELVTDSYRNVVLGLPAAKRPVDPMRFGAD